MPDLAFVEVANALLLQVRARGLAEREASSRLDWVGRLPLRVVPSRVLARRAFDVALERGLSAYDSCYAALAEASGALLVTGDARLAEAVQRSALLPAAAPPS